MSGLLAHVTVKECSLVAVGGYQYSRYQRRLSLLALAVASMERVLAARDYGRKALTVTNIRFIPLPRYERHSQ